MQRAELVEVLGLVAALWPSWKLPADPDEQDVLAGVWFRLLGDLDQACVVAAVDALACDGREFAPQPGIVRRRAMAFTQPAPLPDVDEAWAEVQANIGRFGRYRTPKWSHPAIEAAVNALDWQRLCSSTDVMVDRAHFLKFYGRSHERAQFAQVMPPSVLAIVGALSERLELEAAP